MGGAIIRHHARMAEEQFGAGNIKQIACGGYHTAVLLQTGEVYTCGQNTYGQLGIGSTVTPQPSFVKVTTLPAGSVAESVACGGVHTAVLLQTGEVYTCGQNTDGQLGIGSTATPQPSFVKVTTLPAGSVAESVTCGGFHTAVLLQTGEVYTCGRDGDGQLGIGVASTIGQPSFVKVTTLPAGSVAESITCGYFHTAVLLQTGEVYTCGRNFDGQLGIGVASSTDKSSFVKVTTLPAGSVAESVTCGYYHTVVLLQTGEVYSCGRNADGQLGIGVASSTDKSSFVKVTTLPAGSVAESVACGGVHTAVLLQTGEVYTCGQNTDGQLGIGVASSTDKPSFVKVTTLPAGPVAESVTCGGFHTAVLLQTGEVYTCGQNTDGQLGIGSTATPQPSFIESIPTWEEAA